MQKKIAFVVLKILILTCGLCTCLQPKVWVFSHICDSTELITVPFGETNHTSCALYFFYSTSWKKLLLTWFFNYKVSVWNCQSMWREKENIFCREVDMVKNKNLEDVTVEQLQAEARCIVHHPVFEEIGEGWLCLHFNFVTKHHCKALPWFSFSLLLFIVICYCYFRSTSLSRTRSVPFFLPKHCVLNGGS